MFQGWTRDISVRSEDATCHDMCLRSYPRKFVSRIDPEKLCFSDRHMHNVSRMSTCLLSDPRKSVSRIDTWHRQTLWNPRKREVFFITPSKLIQYLFHQFRWVHYTWSLPACSPLKIIFVWDWETYWLPLNLCTLKNKHISIKKRIRLMLRKIYDDFVRLRKYRK